MREVVLSSGVRVRAQGGAANFPVGTRDLAERLRQARILVVRLGAIGDALRALPAVRRLRLALPQAEIGWAVEGWVYPVLAGNPNVDRFHVLDRAALRAGLPRALDEVLRFAAELRAFRYDAVLDFHGRLKSGLVARLSGAALRVGYARGDSTEGNHLFANVHVCLPDRWENRVVRFLHLLAALGIEGDFDPAETGVYIDGGIRERARAWHRGAGCPALAAYPGTSRARARYQRWPREKWQELLQRLATAGISSVLFWGPDDECYVRSIAERSRGAALLAPRTALPEMMAMIACCRAMVACNTAAMHMAWLQGVPTAAFLGPVRPRTDSPLPPVPSRILWAGSRYREGRRKDRQAEVVRAVTVDEAFAAVCALLGRSEPAEVGGARVEAATF